MNLELAHINELLKKYYDGSSSLKDEKQLKEYFKGQSIPDELASDKQLFIYLSDNEGEVNDVSHANELLNQFVNQKANADQPKRIRQIWYKMAGMAACFAIILSCYFIYYKEHNSIRVKDTYKDPQLAYLEVKRTLLYISLHINQGTVHLNNVSKMNQQLGRLSAFSSFSSGFSKLNLMNKYYNNSANENINKQ